MSSSKKHIRQKKDPMRKKRIVAGIIAVILVIAMVVPMVLSALV